jgi:hypothetical protein
MPYSIGQKICLWQEHVRLGAVIVLKEVIVTITEIKTGVLGEYSMRPASSQSLRGIGDDGKTYEKHWDVWPESQTNDFIGQWSPRLDGEGEHHFWIPQEAVYAYDSLRRHNERFGQTHGVIKRTDINEAEVLPKGDFSYCKEHEYYSPLGNHCFHCMLEGM